MTTFNTPTPTKGRARRTGTSKIGEGSSDHKRRKTDTSSALSTPVSVTHASPDNTSANLVLLLGIDWGTSKNAVAWSLAPEGKSNATAAGIYDIKFTNGQTQSRTAMVWKDKVLVAGHEVEKLLRRGDIAPEDIIEFPKLALYRGPGMSKRVQRVEQQLAAAEKSLDDLMEEHFEAILVQVKEAIGRHEIGAAYTTAEINAFPVRARLSIPQMWTPSARRRLIGAAKRAGMPMVTLASEPQCALAYIISWWADERQAHLRPLLTPGDLILVADIGAGTGDFVLYRLKDDLSAKSRLDAIQQATGALCGSQAINDYLLDIVEANIPKSKGGNLAGLCKNLGISTHSFREKALSEIEAQKLRFSTETDRLRYRITIDGDPEAGGDDDETFDYDFTKKDLSGAHDHVTKSIIKRIDSQLEDITDRLRVIYVTGGLARSSYVLKRLRDEYEHGSVRVVPPDESDCSKNPVSRGSLLRYDNISSQYLPSQYAYAILQDEYFDKKLHTDAVKVSVHGQRLRNKDIAKPSGHIETEFVVVDRLNVFIKQEEIVAPGILFSTDIAQEYFISVQKPVMSAKLVYLDKPGFKTHGPARTADSKKYLDGVHFWAEVKRNFRPSDFTGKGFKIIYNDIGQEEYRINARVAIEYTGQQDMRLGFKIDGIDRVFWENVWEANFSDFVDE